MGEAEGEEYKYDELREAAKMVSQESSITQLRIERRITEYGTSFG